MGRDRNGDVTSRKVAGLAAREEMASTHGRRYTAPMRRMPGFSPRLAVPPASGFASGSHLGHRLGFGLLRRAVFTLVLAVVFAAAFGARAAHATEVGYSRKFGLGFMLGEPTGLSGKVWVGPTNAIDFGLGFFSYGWGNRCYTDNNHVEHCNGYTAYDVIGDYLWQSNIVRGTAQLDWHLGIGGKISGGDYWRYREDGHDWSVGVRGSIGLDLMFQNPNFLEIFFEIAPVLYLIPTFMAPDAALGVRFYF